LFPVPFFANLLFKIRPIREDLPSSLLIIVNAVSSAINLATSREIVLKERRITLEK
jgi:hypothetical protein